MRRQSILSSAMALFLTTATSEATGESPAPVAFEHVNVIPMTRQTVLEDQTVLVVHGRITAVGGSGSVKVLPDAIRVDGRSKFLVPGLTDMHVHLDASREEDLKRYLAHGVTTVRNMNGKPAYLEWREAIRNQERLGPTIVTASQFTSRDDVSAFYRLTTPEQAREAARLFARQGYDLIKVVTLDRNVFFALMEEAKKLDLPVAGHNPSILVDLYAGYPIANLDFSQALTLDEVLGSGMASLEHLDELFNTALARVPSRDAIPGLVARVRASHTAISTLLTRVAHSNAMLDTPDSFLSAERIASIRSLFGDDAVDRARARIENMRELDEPTRSMRRQNVPFVLEILKALVDGGVTVVPGTDTGGLFMHPGAALHDELELFLRAGLSPYDTLRATTVNAAAVLGTLDEAGTIEAGKIADLILVDENPLENFETLRRPAGVMVRGRWLTRSELEAAASN